MSLKEDQPCCYERSQVTLGRIAIKKFGATLAGWLVSWLNKYGDQARALIRSSSTSHVLDD